MRLILPLLTLVLLAVASSNSQADCQAQTNIDVATIKPQLILIGETHGTEQAPAFVGGLVCSLVKTGRQVILALERSSTEQPAMNRYLESAGSPADQQALLDKESPWGYSLQDGRSSQAVLTLIEQMRRLRSAGHQVAVLAMQRDIDLKLPQAKSPLKLTPEASGLFSRLNDRGMADSLAYMAVLKPDYTIVALAGSYHTASQVRPGVPPRQQPMGQVLAEMLPVYVIGLSTAEGGTSWFCTSREDCGSHQVRPFDMYRQGDQIDAVVQLGKISASAPARFAEPAK